MFTFFYNSKAHHYEKEFNSAPLNFHGLNRQKFWLYRLTAMFFLIALATQSCRKTDFAGNPDLVPAAAGERDALSEQAFQEAVADPYEIQGTMTYEHFKYRFAANTPDQYFAHEIRAALVARMDSISQAYEGTPLSNRLSAYLNEGILTQHEYDLQNSLLQMLDAQENSDLSFGQMWYLIRNWEVQTLNNTLIPEKDKQLSLATASVLRNFIKYKYESGELAADRADGCFLGRKTSCWGKYLTNVLLDTLKAAIGVLIPGGATFVILKKAIAKSFGTTSLIGLVKLYLNDDCKCDDETGPEVPPCAPPKGISIIPVNCDANSAQLFRAWGQGSSPGLFQWVITQGEAVDFPSNPNNPITAGPEIRIRQTDPNVPVVIAVAVSCNGNNPPTENLPFNIPVLINSPGTMIVTGAGNVPLGDTETYYFNGTWLTHPNAVLHAFGPSYHGSIVSSTLSSVRVKWNVAAGQYNPASVYATSRNICSNLTISDWETPIFIHN